MSKIDQLSDRNATWCFITEPATSFNKRLFDIGWLRQQDLITGTPQGGRGNTYFLKVDGAELVLREYLRGGLVRHLNPRYYFWRGLQRTRAFRELQMLSHCDSNGLPVSIGYACKVERHGLFYTASLITRKLAGSTLAEAHGTVPDQVWRSIGNTIARFHNEGIWHADLNAHNILIDDDIVSLIDFDRARKLEPNAPNMKANIARLHRSLLKQALKGDYEFNADGWAMLLQAYRENAGSSDVK